MSWEITSHKCYSSTLVGRGGGGGVSCEGGEGGGGWGSTCGGGGGSTCGGCEFCGIF